MTVYRYGAVLILFRVLILRDFLISSMKPLVLYGVCYRHHACRASTEEGMDVGKDGPRQMMEVSANGIANLCCWPFHLQTAVSEALRDIQFEQAYEFFQASRRLIGTPEFGIATILRHGEKSVPVSVTTVAHTPFCRLLCFAAGRHADVVPHPKLLLCAPQAGHRVAQMRDAVRSLLDDADVYVTDWIDARDIPREAGALSLEDHVLTLERFMAQLEPATLDVLAVCQATVPARGAAARLVARGESGLRSVGARVTIAEASCRYALDPRAAQGGV